MIKIRGLNIGQANALRATLNADDSGNVTVTNSTATFHMNRADALDVAHRCQQYAAATTGRVAGNYAYLHAVVRKITDADEQTGAMVVTEPEPETMPEAVGFDVLPTPPPVSRPTIDPLAALADARDAAERARDASLNALYHGVAAELARGASKVDVIARSRLARGTVFKIADGKLLNA